MNNLSAVITAEEKNKQIYTTNQFLGRMPLYYSDLEGKLNKYNLKLIGDLNELVQGIATLKMLYLIIVYELYRFDDKDATLYVNLGWGNIKSLKKQESFFIGVKAIAKQYGIPDERVYRIIKADIKKTLDRVDRLGTYIIRDYTALFWLEDYCLLLEENGETLFSNFQNFYMDGYAAKARILREKGEIFEVDETNRKRGKAEVYQNKWVNYVAKKYFEHAQNELKAYGRETSYDDSISDEIRKKAELKRERCKARSDYYEAKKIAQIMSTAEQTKKEAYNALSMIEDALRSGIPNEFADADFVNNLRTRNQLVSEGYLGRTIIGVIYKNSKRGEYKYSFFHRIDGRGRYLRTTKFDNIKIFKTPKENDDILEIARNMKANFEDADVRIINFSTF